MPAVLVLGTRSSATERAACIDHLTSTSPTATNVVVVTFEQSPDEWLDDWRVRVGDAPVRTAVVGVGHGTRSASAQTPVDPVDEVTRLRIDTVDDPGELDALGDVLTDILNGWADTEAETVLCFRSLTALLEHVDRKAAFRFLHALTAHIDVVGARAHFHIDPTHHSARTITTLEPLFDAIVNLPPEPEAGSSAPLTAETVSVEFPGDRDGDGSDAPPRDVGPGVDRGGEVTDPGAAAADTGADRGSDAGPTFDEIPDAESVGDDGAATASDRASSTDAGVAAHGPRDVRDRDRRPREGDVDAPFEGSGRYSSTAGEAPGAPATGDGEEITVLVVEGSTDIAELVATVLEGRGFETTTATDSGDAIDLLGTGGIDCVVCGETLPDTSGLAFVERVDEFDPDLPVMLLASDVDPDRARAAGATGTFARDRTGYRHLATAIPGAVARRADREYRALVEYAGVPLVLAAPDGTVEHVNPAFEGFTGDPERTAVGRGLRTYVAETDVETANDAWETVRDGDVWEGELTLVVGGDRVPTRMILSPVTTARGDVRQVVAVLVDVTAYEKRARMLRAERDRADETVELLAHDTRNILQATQGNVEFLRESLGDVESSIDRLSALMDEASTVAAGTTIDGVTAREIEATARTAWDQIDTVRGSLVVADSRPLVADHDLLLRLFENLFTNAVTHGGAAVTVTVGTTSDGFYVADDGTGVPPDERDAIFDEGYSTGGSTGLGLTIVQRIALAHGWDVDLVESEDGGARFEFSGVTWE